ncbi:putative membrane protein [Amycolatopsis sulphurea]|uniref:Putative membrane protein n=1 Tax=Amycolatopsis sulphurea TaxID=76022 RepID=A0A2A9F9S2_9PSEU|nr:DUF2079 domain-containing protein [Amycolatopsis sulphurea]PFG47918.1 putative membrane protein [Amycolatopsis sulphurea]
MEHVGTLGTTEGDRPIAGAGSATPARIRLRLPYILSGCAFVIYAVWSLSLHAAFQSGGQDLGLFEQAIRSYADGHWPTSDLKGPGIPLLGDHFSPILAVLAPFYLLWPSPAMLLVAQAALLALSVVPVTRHAIRVLGTVRGVAIGCGYVLSTGLLETMIHDFHEVCFAVPMLAFAGERLLRREWRWAVAYAVPLVLVKEDLSVTLAVLGLYLVVQGQRRLGWATVAFGVLTTAVIIKVVLPLINGGVYAYGSKWGGFAPFAGFPIKVATLAVLLAPMAFAALRSPLAMLLVPTLAWRLLSGFHFYWSPALYYDAVLIPIAFLAAVDGIRRARGTWLRRAAPICAVVAALCSTTVVLLHANQPRWTDEQQAAAREVLARVPDGATIAAAGRLAPHLTSRCRVLLYPTYPSGAEQSEWVVVTRPEGSWPLSVPEQERRLAELTRTSYDVVVRNDTAVLLHRRSGM